MSETLVGRKVRLTGELWRYEIVNADDQHAITHDPGWTDNYPGQPGITMPQGYQFAVILDPEHDEYKYWGGVLLSQDGTDEPIVTEGNAVYRAGFLDGLLGLDGESFDEDYVRGLVNGSAMRERLAKVGMEP